MGIIYGTVGVIALMLGGLLGGYAIYRKGLKFWIWIMVCAMHLPDLVFVYLSQAMPDNFYLINLCVAVEQFGYGFGFTAYTMFMIMVSEGEYKTVHYAISTGIMALGMMVPAMVERLAPGAAGLSELLPLGHGRDDPGVHRDGAGED